MILRNAVVAALLSLLLGGECAAQFRGRRQNCPGGICPVPAVAPQIPAATRAWLNATLPDGRIAQVWGWQEVDPYGRVSIRYFEAENPQLVSQPKPSPQPVRPEDSKGPAPKAGDANYGLQLESIHEQPSGTLVTRDGAFRAALNDALGRAAPRPIAPESLPHSKAGPIKESIPEAIGRQVDLPLAEIPSGPRVSPWLALIGACGLVGAYAIARFTGPSPVPSKGA